MLYLFCNLTYGSPFLDVAREVSRSHGVDFVVVLSDKNTNPGRMLGSTLLRRRLRERLWSRRIKMNVLLERDVNSLSFLSKINANDHGIIAGFNQILKPALINRFASLVNFHPSILPFYRGPVPSYWCIHNGEKKSGFTLHRVTETIDKGEILYQEEVLIDTDDPDLLDKRIADRGAECFRRYVLHLLTGAPWPRVARDAAAVYETPVDYASFPNNDNAK